MSDFIIEITEVCVLGVSVMLLHELGHWIMFKRYDIPYRFKMTKSYMSLEFEIAHLSKRGFEKIVRLVLAGAFLPLIVLIPCFLSMSAFLIWMGLVVCLANAIYTCYETISAVSFLTKEKEEEG